MPDSMTPRQFADENWYWYLNGTFRTGLPRNMQRQLDTIKFLHHTLPGAPRCLECAAPLGGVGGWLMKPLGTRPSSMTPRLCNQCEKMILATEGGAEVELSLLFADIRGSTTLAEKKGVTEYKEFIQRFYQTAAGILIENYGLVNRLVGDQVIGIFAPHFTGANHAGVAIQAAREILRATGHTDPNGPWAPVGVGVHTGPAYVGAVGSKDGVNEIAVLGNTANVTARLSSKAARGEILISDQAAALADLTDRTLEKRRLKLKGITRPMSVRVMTVAPERQPAASAHVAASRRLARKTAA